MTDRLDAFVSFRHYYDHVRPIFDALPEERRGFIFATSDLRHEVHGPDVRYSWPLSSSAALIVAGAQDLRYSVRPKVLLQHGAGMQYQGVQSPSYAGGPGREHAGLFLCPNEMAAQADAVRYPGACAVAVGCPKLDQWAKVRAPHDGTIGVTFHWDCRLRTTDGENVPESGWAWPAWRDQIADLARTRPVLGHAHPRARGQLREWWASIGVEFVADPVELLARADVLLADNTSLLCEWAACGRPIVFLNDPAWRRHIHHGGRFWTWPEGQLSCWPGDDLDITVDIALHDPAPVRDARQRMVHTVYGPIDGRASERAAGALLQWEADGYPHRIAYAESGKPCGC